MSLNPSATYPVTITVGSKVFSVNATSFKRKCSNKPIVINKPMTSQDGSTSPETLYKDLKNINNVLDITFSLYSDGTNSPIAIAEDFVDKLHKEAPPVIVNYRGYTFDCVFLMFYYDDRPKVSQKWNKAIANHGGTISPSYMNCTLSLTKGTRRI